MALTEMGELHRYKGELALAEQAFSGSAQMVPGARRIPPGEFERHIDTIPLDKEIILYCT